MVDGFLKSYKCQDQVILNRRAKCAISNMILLNYLFAHCIDEMAMGCGRWRNNVVLSVLNKSQIFKY
ncbi:unnamed protein product [Cyberlindnera jadinii]|uniref:Uncharacterized protein n=1 Tax=Cyberlindnera jadinii (strain ATCC 18201 / CBS 1600 / BCRC 20928 / JCM 3617 / NBRC 0987 / NRRL Y-1542) TaxID=983966 RepID=A0A0H5C2X4_CYBJN|nr:unnamed protein product [Cyberlindnera jadinii]